MAKNALHTEFVPFGENVALARLMGYLPRRRVAEFRANGQDMEGKVPDGCDAVLQDAQRTGAQLRLKMEVSSVSNPALPFDRRETVLEIDTAMEQLKL